MGRLASGHAHNPAHYPDYSAHRGAAHLAVQQRLGLLPERRTGFDSFDRADSGANGPALAEGPSADSRRAEGRSGTAC